MNGSTDWRRIFQITLSGIKTIIIRCYKAIMNISRNISNWFMDCFYVSLLWCAIEYIFFWQTATGVHGMFIEIYHLSYCFVHISKRVNSIVLSLPLLCWNIRSTINCLKCFYHSILLFTCIYSVSVGRMHACLTCMGSVGY